MTRLYSLHQIRIRIVSIIFFICSTAILGKMFYIQSFQAAIHREMTLNAGITERSVKGFRGNIYDRNGKILAETIKTPLARAKIKSCLLMGFMFNTNFC